MERTKDRIERLKRLNAPDSIISILYGYLIIALAALAFATPALAEEYDAPTAFNGKVESAIQETLSLACTPYKGDKVYIDITFGGPNNESIDKLVVNHVLPDGRSYNRAKQYTSQTELDVVNEKHLYQWAGNTPKGDRMIADLKLVKGQNPPSLPKLDTNLEHEETLGMSPQYKRAVANGYRQQLWAYSEALLRVNAKYPEMILKTTCKVISHLDYGASEPERVR